jgi:hypothetical protein
MSRCLYREVPEDWGTPFCVWVLSPAITVLVGLYIFLEYAVYYPICWLIYGSTK